MISTLKRAVRHNLSNLPGWRTNRKLIVFESDDWGAVRMSSTSAYNQIEKEGILTANDGAEGYLKNDGLASENDLTGLFEVLSSVKDKNGNSAVFTAVSVVANPDFEKIKNNGFSEYHYETFLDTLKRYPQHTGSYELWKEGMANRLFLPQFHGREHLNVINWLKALQAGEKDTHFTFDLNVFGVRPRNPLNHVSYQAAFEFYDIGEIEYQRSVISDGLSLFHKLHGYHACFFVPPNGPFNNTLQKPAADSGIKYLGIAKMQAEPIGEGNFKRHIHYLGKPTKFGQNYLTRNSTFEPGSNEKSDWIDSCMNEIAVAFRWRKPAVISSHRVNYIGWLNPVNRDKGLGDLKILLDRITKQWPDAEFISTEELGKLVTSA